MCTSDLERSKLLAMGTVLQDVSQLLPSRNPWGSEEAKAVAALIGEDKINEFRRIYTNVTTIGSAINSGRNYQKTIQEKSMDPNESNALSMEQKMVTISQMYLSKTKYKATKLEQFHAYDYEIYNSMVLSDMPSSNFSEALNEYNSIFKE